MNKEATSCYRVQQVNIVWHKVVEHISVILNKSNGMLVY